MLERLAAWFLNTYVAEYVGNLNTDQLSIGLLSGAVELEKLTLKKDALHKLKLPVEIKAGYIGKLRLQVPVRYIKSQPWVLQIDELYFIAGPPDIDKYDVEEEREAAQLRKINKLNVMEQKWREEQQGKTSSWWWSSLASSFTSTIAENLQVTINNIHIRYEDPEVGGPSNPLVVGVIIEQLTSQSTDMDWEPGFTSGGEKGFKLVSLCNLNLYWDTELLSHLEGHDFMEAMYHKSLSVSATHNMMSSSYFTGSAPPTQHIIQPTSAQAKITLNRSTQPLKIVDGPRVSVSINVNDVPIVLSENQFNKFVQLSDAFKFRMISQKYRHLRPKESIKKNPKSWWRFSISCIRENIRETHKRLSLSFILQRARQCTLYVSAYTQHLTSSHVSADTTDVLESAENELSYEEIVILRRVAMQRIEKERALAEEARKVAEQEMAKNSYLQQWLPGWWSTTPTNSGNEGAEFDQEELLDELGLEMDGTSKLLRDRIFATVSFNLIKGSLQLVTEDESEGGVALGPRPLLEIELSMLSCNCDYRPRLKYGCVQVQLGGVAIYDHFNEESVFTTLVEPKIASSSTVNQSSSEVFTLQYVQQEQVSIKSHTLSLVTRPLDVVYNKATINRIKQFFKGKDTLQTANKISGQLVGGVDHTLFDHVTLKLDISAPHIIIPKDFTDTNTPVVVVDLGHLTFESITDWPEEVILIKEQQEEDDTSSIGDIDDDDEFMTPPSTPPLLSEEGDHAVTPTELKTALNKPHPLKSKIKGYTLQLAEIQVLVGDNGCVQSALVSGRSSLHLLEQFSVLVHIHRLKPNCAQLTVNANLSLLHFHLDGNKVNTLLSCFLSPLPPSPSPSPPLPPHLPMDKSVYMSFINTQSMYESAIDTSHDMSHDTPTPCNEVKQLKRHLSADISEMKLIQAQININELMVDINDNDSCIVELKVLGVRGGVLKRHYDTCARLIIEDICVVDKLQEYGPQYELIVCSSGEKLTTNTTIPSAHHDIFNTSLPFLLNISLLSISSLSPDHPSVMLSEQGGGYTALVNDTTINKLTLQCTAVDLLANQKTLVELISLCKSSIPFHLINKTTPASDMPTQPTLMTTPTQTEISLELEKLSVRTLRGTSGCGPNDSLLTASFEFSGLGITTKFGTEINIDGYIEGIKIIDLTPNGRLHSNIISLGACREGRDSDMITTMMTSYDTLNKMSDCVHFSINRLLRDHALPDHTHFPKLYDLHVSAHVPSILYVHSVNFIREMEQFGIDFLQYFDNITGSVKTAALGVATGLVKDKSKLADRLSQLSNSFGGRSLSVDDTDDNVGVVNDRVLINILIKSPVVVLPSSSQSQHSLIAHLGEICIENCFIDLQQETTTEVGGGEGERESEYVLSSNCIDKLTLKITNVTLHSSHDPASRCWLISEIQDEAPCVSGTWYKILNETSFLLQVERALGGGRSLTTPPSENTRTVDVKIHCTCSNSIFISLPNSVFQQIKTTLKHGLYQPVNKNNHLIKTSNDSVHTNIETVMSSTSNDNLPKLYCSFSLSRLSIELKHLIGSEVKDIVFISFEDFVASLSKTTLYHTHFELALKSVVIEDLLQNNENYRYILSSTSKPHPFSSPVITPTSSLYSATSPRTLLPLFKLVSSPRPPKMMYSPLRSFNPFSSETTPTCTSRSEVTTPTSETTPTCNPQPEVTTPTADNSSLLTDVQDVVSISGSFISEDCPDYSTTYNSTSINTDISFSTVFIIVNLQTWVLLFDYLGIGVPTPPSSPLSSPFSSSQPSFNIQEEESLIDEYSLNTDGSVYIKPPIKPPVAAIDQQRSTVWGSEGKLSASITLKVQSLTVTFNKPEHPLARGTASELQAQVNLTQSNVRLRGSLGQGTIIDLTNTGSFYRERLTTSGDQALSFDIFKFGRKDPELERPYDISATIQLSTVRYLHTMRFLKEIIAFCSHFPQLIDAFQRMKAASQGYLSYAPDRKPRILLEIEADGPMILIPKHAFSPELMGGAIKRLTVHNRFLYDGSQGTLSHSTTNSSISRVASSPGLITINNQQEKSGLHRTWSSQDHTDREAIESVLSAAKGPCLMDCIELVLSDVDVFSARKKPSGVGVALSDGYQYIIERDSGQLLKERGTLKLAIERNLYEDFCRSVPDIHINGTLSAVHLMLDKRQLEIIKGLIDMNLGEQIDEFEKPSSVIHDPVAQPIVAAVWTGFRFHINFVEVQLEFLQSRATPTCSGSLTQSLVLFDIQSSQFTFESHSDQSKTVDFTTHAVIVHDTRYEGYSDKPNVFEEVLKPRQTETTPTKSFQVELHVTMSPSAIKASILLNKLRLIGVINLLLELKQFVIDKLPEETTATDVHVLEEVDGSSSDSPLLNSLLKNTLQQQHKTLPYKEEKKVDRDVKVGLSITETDLVIVEDLSSLSSNAVVMKGTVVLNFHSPPNVKGPPTLHCSIDGLELFSCCVAHEDDTALSILDPMSIGVELKPLSQATAGTHLLEFDVRQLNVRLSYNDIKLFIAILQNLQLSTKASMRKEEDKTEQTNTVNETVVKKLLPLGFTRDAILKELHKCEGDINMVALQLIEEENRISEENNDKKIKLKSLEIIMGSLNLYLIDDCLNHDVPLFELSLSSLQATNQIASGMEGNATTCLSLNYYNRNISSWEPIMEPWKVQLLWKKITHFSTDLDTNEKPNRITFSLTSPEQLNVNITSSFLLLLKETQTSWSSDFKMASNNNTSSHKSKEKQLLKIHRRSSSRDMGGAPDTPPSNVQHGLTLLHSVRFISQSRQRTKFIPFCLRNSTGLPLSFATLTSLPSHVLFNPSLLLGAESSVTTPTTKWINVQPNEEMPFDFVSRQKIRHKDTRSLVIHQLRVKVNGFDEIHVPISVDKIGIFFRDISGRGQQVRLYFAISLNDTRKYVNIRSGLIIRNTLELPIEVKLDPPPNSNASSIGLPVISPGSFAAIPIHLTDWFIRARPQGWGLMFCSHPLLWDHVTSSRQPSSDLRMCENIGDNKRPPFRFCIEVTQTYTPIATSNVTIPAHSISLRPVFTVCNLLPYGFHFCYRSKEKYIPQGQEVPIHNINSLKPVIFSITKLESFEFSEDCQISLEDINTIKSLIVRDKIHSPLYLCVSTELVAKGSIKISIWCPYWLINRTGLPLVFASQGDPSSNKCPGQFEEHETATNISPLLFSYHEDDLLQKCQVRLGRGQEEDGVPSWSSGFRMLREGGVMRLFVRRGQGRPDREYQIGMEIKRGSSRYQVTRLVTFVARFQLENRTSFKLGYLQRHLLNKDKLMSILSDTPTILPGSLIAFHWPRADLDQLLTIKVCDIDESYWSGGFPLEQDKSFHINMRCSYGRSVFIRCETIQRGATYHVIFSDASDYPPPFKLENLSQISVQCYQQSVSDVHQYSLLNPGQSVPYSWDEVTLPEKLCVHVKEVSEPRPFDLSNFGPQGKVYYENYFYIVAMDTKTDQSHLPESHRQEGDLVLDVPQGTAVILTRKGLQRRSQLWRMTASGQLVHILTSSLHSSSGGNYVLDLAGSLPQRYHGNTPIPLVVAKVNSKRSTTQSWEFKDGRLVLSSYQYMCVQCRHGYESRMEGIDAVVGPVGSSSKEEFQRLKKSPGSGVLSVNIIHDGPTRVLRITDENKKYTYTSVQDDWIIVEHGLTARATGGGVAEIDHTQYENQVKNELSLSLSLDKGVSISLINSLPEELLLATATGLRVEFVSTAVHQCINATIQYIQVDNQMTGGFHPIVLFPTPSSVGEVETHFPVVNCFIERLPHSSPLAIVFRTVDVKITQFTVLLEEKLLFKLIQWSGMVREGGGGGKGESDELIAHTRQNWSTSSSFPTHQLYTEQLRVSTTELLVSMHTTSQLPDDLQRIKKRLGFPLVQFESPIILEGFHKTHMLGAPQLFVDAVAKHYKKVIQGQAVTILGSVDFLGNPMGLINDVASGIHGIIATQPDVVGLLRDVTHGMSDTTSKLTGTVSHVLGHATGDSSFQEEREQNLESCQTSGDHFKAGLINLTSGIFGGMTSILTQPYKGAVEEGVGGFIWGIGKGVVGTVAKPVAGLLDFASGTSAALRETMSRVSRNMPHPMRLRRCCVGVAGTLTCYSVQLARGQEYLLTLNDGNTSEKLVAYEKFSTNSLIGSEMRLIISSQCLYFFEESPPDLSSIETLIKLEKLVDCRATQAKTTIPAVFLVLSVREKEDNELMGGGNGSLIKTKKYKCENESQAKKIAQLINYAKNLHNEEKMIIRMPRLQNETIW